MSWLKNHSESENLASLADFAFKNGDFENAIDLYNRAAEYEEKAISYLDDKKKRTMGITAVSIAALYYKGKNIHKAERAAYNWLSKDILPEFASIQLQDILQTIWNDKVFQKAGIEFAEGTVLVSVSGGLVVPGGAPLDLIHRKVDEVKTIFFRTIEWLLNRPFRKRGAPESEIQEQFRPWIFQAAPGSYQFAVRVQKPKQMPLFPDGTPEIEEVTSKFFDILRATSKESPEELKNVVPNEDYRQSFLKLSRNLSPTGKTFESIEIKSATDFDAEPIIFKPDSRKTLNKSLQPIKQITSGNLKTEKMQLSGILRALHLDKDWIEINMPDKQETIKIYQTGDVIDDIVGPMVNQKVLVDVLFTSKGKYLYQDIQYDD